ncbi:MAG: SH3 domain-containing protein [Anaerolineaceae bacterium]|nr:SH3 domain-containing protein [Anaerolineaceae bacterium]
MVDYILIAIFAVIAAFVTKYLAPFLLYILKSTHKLVTVVNLLLYIGVFAGTFIALYLWPQPRVLADSAIAWGETTYQHVVSILPTRTPTSIPDKQTMTPTKMLVSTKTPAPTAITSSDPLVFSPSLSGVVVTDFGRLNLREGPGTDYPSLGMLETGDKVAIVQRNVAGDWFSWKPKKISRDG